jgi:hypothetical protein
MRGRHDSGFVRRTCTVYCTVGCGQCWRTVPSTVLHFKKSKVASFLYRPPASQTVVRTSTCSYLLPLLKFFKNRVTIKLKTALVKTTVIYLYAEQCCSAVDGNKWKQTTTALTGCKRSETIHSAKRRSDCRFHHRIFYYEACACWQLSPGCAHCDCDRQTLFSGSTCSEMVFSQIERTRNDDAAGNSRRRCPWVGRT